MSEGYLKTWSGISPNKNGGGGETIQVRAIPLSMREGYLKTEGKISPNKNRGGCWVPANFDILCISKMGGPIG